MPPAKISSLKKKLAMDFEARLSEMEKQLEVQKDEMEQQKTEMEQQKAEFGKKWEILETSIAKLFKNGGPDIF